MHLLDISQDGPRDPSLIYMAHSFRLRRCLRLFRRVFNLRPCCSVVCTISMQNVKNSHTCWVLTDMVFIWFCKYVLFKIYFGIEGWTVNCELVMCLVLCMCWKLMDVLFSFQNYTLMSGRNPLTVIIITGWWSCFLNRVRSLFIFLQITFEWVYGPIFFIYRPLLLFAHAALDMNEWEKMTKHANVVLAIQWYMRID